MKWFVRYTKASKNDLKDIYRYIRFELKSPEAASELYNKIKAEIASLSNLPLRYRLYLESPWYEKGIRFFPVDNYLVFYCVNSKGKEVFILRIMYAGRDVRLQLKETLF